MAHEPPLLRECDVALIANMPPYDDSPDDPRHIQQINVLPQMPARAQGARQTKLDELRQAN